MRQGYECKLNYYIITMYLASHHNFFGHVKTKRDEYIGCMVRLVTIKLFSSMPFIHRLPYVMKFKWLLHLSWSTLKLINLDTSVWKLINEIGKSSLRNYLE